jgi:hypothetical protein
MYYVMHVQGRTNFIQLTRFTLNRIQGLNSKVAIISIN